MNDNVVPFTGYTRLNLDADVVLSNQDCKNLEPAIVIGTIADSNEFYLASSTTDKMEIVFFLQKAIHKIMNGDYDT